ncbi:MAG: SprB repeat-containing protein, partial [Bacteroidota bacterium]|nr:SprB repeat-containing protein [Bacteroidota bacterium]
VAGTYGLTVTDANFCSYAESLVVGFDSAVSLFATGAVTDILCYGYCNGAIDLTVSAGNSPYSFIWSNGEITEDVSNLCANFYSVTISDSNLDTIILSFDILQPDHIVISSIITNETFSIGNDGEIDLTVSGGTPPYSFSWSNGVTNEDIDSLSAGYYSVTITDANYCLGIDSFEVDLLAFLGNVFHANSPLFNDGYIELFGGDSLTNPVSFSWSNGATTKNIFNLSPGIYTVTYTDAFNQSGSVSFEVGVTNMDYPFPWFVASSTLAHTIHIPGGNAVTIKGQLLMPGDKVGVFYDSLGYWACGGFIEWNGNPQNITIYGDTIGNAGFDLNEQFRFIVRSQLYNRDFIAEPTFDLSGSYSNDSLFSIGGISGLLSLEADSLILQSVLLWEGFNWFYTTYPIVDPHPINVFSAAVGSLELLKSQYLQIYWPAYGLCGFSSIDTGLIYQAFMNNTDVIQFPCILSDNVLYQINTNTCYNVPDGFIEINSSFGVPPYSYIWNTGATANTITNIPPNTNYSVTVTDALLVQQSLNLTSGSGNEYPVLNFDITNAT